MTGLFFLSIGIFTSWKKNFAIRRGLVYPRVNGKKPKIIIMGPILNPPLRKGVTIENTNLKEFIIE